MEPQEQKPKRVIQIPLKRIIKMVVGFAILGVLLFGFLLMDGGSSYEIGRMLNYVIPFILLISILLVVGGLILSSKGHLVTYGFIGIVISIILFVGGRLVINEYGMSPGSLSMDSIPQVPSMPSVGVDSGGYGNNYNYGYGKGQPDITDNREFNKVSYNATIKTRNVRETVRDVKGAVRDVEGRVDREQSAKDRGYVSFVVPKSKFDDFRDQVESLGNAKLYT
jgi:hypothetical protein